ncbi:8-amino-7-oxononanoate synthase [Thiomonas arsenitoxydans]|jgi:8-amino-7-oxononanoate synthase|uniref:8-amino-7-oxononanoate synthase n=1 Tax=Thiomonas arsenitoxydans (strain DSM 22701 / CIP 110005 / 3As) TaxID=426114 RepID=A0ABM9T3F6_THIA3|nr:8-amino-7-oxononanoate synthase [Thiomonas arsenitoxydans]CQR45048.1 8-amino-7-oxononanoate synthase [Thiomonas sp. CB3]CQR29699.1 8-amino-7-oxononanoate synthase [Thiomonas arsenitoxydans]CQR34777.1 8-amino-7-oxononanoate synthase [Thiomonas arsenitoxydans]CQR36093.1 8-amino-7-oxononanoate synthase [Thiomonas arsenitoxydans]CQR36167.1 8-amino-7-oxononanoate synthase [Thiomonas arsenitoxydans]
MLIDHLNQQLHDRVSRGLRRQRRTAETPCEPRQQVSVGHRTDGTNARELLGFCSNDYLGLANHPVLIESLAEGARLFGAGSGASHLVSGHSRAHAALEDDLAAWLAPHIPGARALTFCTGYMANLALLTALADAQTTIFSDKLNHASLIDGALLSKAPLRRFAHRDLTVLSQQLEACRTPIKLIVTDAVFSMDGDVADLPGMLTLAEQHDAYLIVDDAHGFGVLGPYGQGTLAHFDLYSERIIYMGTMGKAAGMGGAFVAAHPTIINWLIQAARTYIYSTATPPALAHALRESLRLIRSEEGEKRRVHLQQRIAQLRVALSALIEGHSELGWKLGVSETAIQPLIVGDNAAALSLAAALDAKSLWVPAIRPPTVPVGTARLRITLRATHSVDDVQCLITGLSQAAKALA